MKSTVVHIRMPLDLKDQINQLAIADRRPWTQMAVVLLRDAVTPYGPKKSKGHRKKPVDSRI